MTQEQLIGKKVRGFKFDGYPPGWTIEMLDCIGKIGVCKSFHYPSNSIKVLFDDGQVWHYPVEQIKKHIL